LGVARAADDDFDLEAMTVEASAFVVWGQVRQEVGGLELEGFAEFDIHLLFPIGPGDEFGEAESAVVSPGEWGVLHTADGADAGDAPSGELEGELMGAGAHGGEGDGGDGALDGGGGLEGFAAIGDGLDVDESVQAGGLELGIGLLDDGPGGGIGAGPDGGAELVSGAEVVEGSAGGEVGGDGGGGCAAGLGYLDFGQLFGEHFGE